MFAPPEASTWHAAAGSGVLPDSMGPPTSLQRLSYQEPRRVRHSGSGKCRIVGLLFSTFGQGLPIVPFVSGSCVERAGEGSFGVECRAKGSRVERASYNSVLRAY